MSFKETVHKLDLAGLVQREERREQVRKEEQQKAQQLTVDGAAAYRRGLRSYLAESYRQVDIERMKSDPAYAFFKLANRDPFST